MDALSAALERVEHLRNEVQALRLTAQPADAALRADDTAAARLPAAAFEPALLELHDGQASRVLPVRLVPDEASGCAKMLRAVALPAQRCIEPQSAQTARSSRCGVQRCTEPGGEQQAPPKPPYEAARPAAGPAEQPASGSPDTQRTVDQLLAALRAEQSAAQAPSAAGAALPGAAASLHGRSDGSSSGPASARLTGGRSGNPEHLQRLRQEFRAVEQEMQATLRAVHSASGRSRTKAAGGGSTGCSSSASSSNRAPVVPPLPLGALAHQGARSSSFSVAALSARAGAKETRVSLSALLQGEAAPAAVAVRPRAVDAAAEQPEPAAKAGHERQLLPLRQEPEAGQSEEHTPPQSPAVEGSASSSGRSRLAMGRLLAKLSPLRRLQSPPPTVQPAPHRATAAAAAVPAEPNSPLAATLDLRPRSASSHESSVAVVQGEHAPALVPSLSAASELSAAPSSARKRRLPDEGQLSQPAAKKISPESSRRRSCTAQLPGSQAQQPPLHPARQPQQAPQPPPREVPLQAPAQQRAGSSSAQQALQLSPRWEAPVRAAAQQHGDSSQGRQALAPSHAVNVVPLARSPVKRAALAGKPPRPNNSRISQAAQQPAVQEGTAEGTAADQASGSRGKCASPHRAGNPLAGPAPAAPLRLSCDAIARMQLPQRRNPSCELEGESTWVAVTARRQAAGAEVGTAIASARPITRPAAPVKAAAGKAAPAHATAVPELAVPLATAPSVAAPVAAAAPAAAAPTTTAPEPGARGAARAAAAKSAVSQAATVPLRCAQDHPLVQDLTIKAPGLAELTVGELMAALGRGMQVQKAWASGSGNGSVRVLQVLPGAPGRAAQAAYPSGLLRRRRTFAVKRVVAASGAWRPGAFLLLDTPHGMLRLQPRSAAEYGTWLLALNAVLLGGGDASRPAAELPWTDALLLTL